MNTRSKTHKWQTNEVPAETSPAVTALKKKNELPAETSPAVTALWAHSSERPCIYTFFAQSQILALRWCLTLTRLKRRVLTTLGNALFSRRENGFWWAFEWLWQFVPIAACFITNTQLLKCQYLYFCTSRFALLYQSILVSFLVTLAKNTLPDTLCLMPTCWHTFVLVDSGELSSDSGLVKSIAAAFFGRSRRKLSSSGVSTKVQIPTPRNYFYISTNTDTWGTTIETKTQLLRCQYLYFCTSKASKLSTFGRSKRTRFWDVVYSIPTNFCTSKATTFCTSKASKLSTVVRSTRTRCCGGVGRDKLSLLALLVLATTFVLVKQVNSRCGGVASSDAFSKTWNKYLYFCTSEASKLSTFGWSTRTRFWGVVFSDAFQKLETNFR